MPVITRRLPPAAILALTAVSAHGQDGAAAAGHAFGRDACRACHMVEAKQQKPRRIVIGPAFRDIANTRGMTATALRVFLTTSHPKTPNLILTPDEIADVSAYILSLRWPSTLLTGSRRTSSSQRASRIPSQCCPPAVS